MTDVVSHSRGPRFAFRPEKRTPWLGVFIVLLSPSRQMPERSIKLGAAASVRILSNYIIH
jgi:hypothetical protein